MSVVFNPYDWYWRADDGRVFSSAQQATVPDTDQGYIDFMQWAGPTPWPRDGSGEQTTQSMQEVLSPYGLFADLLAYAANKRWETEVGGITFNGAPVSTDDRSKQMVTGARLAAQADPDFVTPWVMDDNSVVQLNAQAIIALSDAVLAHVQACFTVFATVRAGIADGTVTTRQQVDAAFEG